MSDEITLGKYIQEAINDRKMSANSLGFASGIAQSTISSLLKQGEDPDLPGPHPQVLSAVCDVLDLDYLYVFQLAGYIPASYSPQAMHTGVDLIQRKFTNLSRMKRQIFIEIIDLLEQSGDLDLTGDTVLAILDEVRKLQKHYPLFRVRRFTRNDELGWVAATVLRIRKPTILINFPYRRLSQLFKDSPDVTITKEHILEVTDHIYARVLLSILLPRKDIPTGLEKLYWLILPPGSLEHHDLTSEQAESIRALWKLLEHVTGFAQAEQ